MRSGCLEAYSWPGNVRELENVIERAVVLARDGSRIEVQPPAGESGGALRDARAASRAGGGGAGRRASPHRTTCSRSESGTPLAEVEQRLLEETLKITKGNKTLAARILGIDPKTVFRKLKAGEAEDASEARR